MKKIFIVPLLFFVKTILAQVPFDYIDDEPQSYFQKVFTTKTGEKWIILYNEYSGETEKFTSPCAILYDIVKVDSVYRKRLKLQQKIKCKQQITEEEAEESFEVSDLEIPYQYVEGQHQIDSVCASLQLTISPLTENIHTYFNYKIQLNKTDSAQFGCMHNANDPYFKISNYDIHLYDKKGELFSANLVSQYLSNSTLTACFERAFCWQYNDRHFGVILFNYLDTHGVDNLSHLILYNRL